MNRIIFSLGSLHNNPLTTGISFTCEDITGLTTGTTLRGQRGQLVWDGMHFAGFYVTIK